MSVGRFRHYSRLASEASLIKHDQDTTEACELFAGIAASLCDAFLLAINMIVQFFVPHIELCETCFFIVYSNWSTVNCYCTA